MFCMFCMFLTCVDCARVLYGLAVIACDCLCVQSHNCVVFFVIGSVYVAVFGFVSPSLVCI